MIIGKVREMNVDNGCVKIELNSFEIIFFKKYLFIIRG